ncbi:peptidoglycan DD-metalloendopeptidase family protein [Streptomyces sp. NBC_00094]|uniref:peptidoglycan DD-metalloendopeptidase family protein n=1 Tax=Streptomyces sp. NBC_00094 TaxID=2903620 RepID=UPI00224DC432|nr:peptidoglycan DD-metalloendopeptidase family protein [Streptomyces sp. NBC_00094]MCX5391684.1 peptidoglycan DD-metalloendopeptidase family protein [Streptomyces sp. NBC_00094]
MTENEALHRCGGGQGCHHVPAGVSRRNLLRGAVAGGGALAVGGIVLPTSAHAAPVFYNPFTAYAITDPWNPPEHNGVDFAMAVGTALPAPASGTIENIPYNGSAGHTVSIHHGDGYRSQYLHLSQFRLSNGTSVSAGTIVGYSGGAMGSDGSGNSDGPHLHWHVVNPSAVRQSPYDFMGSGPTPPPAQGEGLTLQKIAGAGGYTGALDGVPGTYTWRGVQQVVTGYGYTGPVDGAPGTYTYMAFQRMAYKGGYGGTINGVMDANTWKGVQTICRRFGYSGPIDGAPGPNTYAAVQRIAKLGGYTGPADGVMGPNSWKGLQRLFTGFGYTGPIDGAPGKNTYMGLQRMAQLGGYGGPVDGIPGDYTWAALAKLV